MTGRLRLSDRMVSLVPTRWIVNGGSYMNSGGITLGLNGSPLPTDQTDKLHLGDGVYVTSAEKWLMLTTEEGPIITNRIVLAPRVYAALMKFVDQLQVRKQ